MLFYILGFLIFILTIFANLKPQQRRLPAGKSPWAAEKIGILLTAAALGLILILQSADSNGDLTRYNTSYDKMALREFSYFQNNWNRMKDPVYYFCAFIFSQLGFSFFAWKALISVVFIIAVYKLILGYSANVSISYIALITLGLFGFSLSGLRQLIAFSVILFAYPYLREHKLIKFMLMVLIAGAFHSTAWICIFMYPIYRFKANTRNVLLLLGISIPVLLNTDRLMRLYLSLTGTADIYEDHLKQDGGLSAMGLVIWGSIWLFCTVFLYRRKSNALDPRLCNLLLVSFVLRIVSVTAYATFFRIAMYFSVFSCLVVADACACKEESTFMVRLKTLGVSVALFLYYFVASNANILTYTV